MSFDFTTVPDRRGTHSLKWDNVLPSPGRPDVIPLWVADMDFAPPPAVTEALAARVAHPIFGYTNLPAGYFETVAGWYGRRYGRSWKPADFLAAPSVLHALSMAIRALTKPGERLLNLPPVYYPFYKEALLNDRDLLDVPLVRRGRWEMDFEALDAALTASTREGRPVRALLFSAPHNPTGRVWTHAELKALGELAIRHDFLIFSDEIHADLVLPGRHHLGPSDLPELADRTMVFAGPNKTFNLAGLPISHVVTLNDTLKAKMRRAIEADFYDQPNVLSLTAAWAAYQHGEPWLEELLHVIEANKARLDEFLASLSRDGNMIPVVAAQPLEATYLAWADFTGVVRAYGFENDKDLARYLEEIGRVKMTAGSVFKTGGENHLRFNLATPPALLKEGLGRIRSALEARGSRVDS